MPNSDQRYHEALAFLTGRINFEKAPVRDQDKRQFKLERMQRLLELIGRPDKRIPVVHVAGTKGKGSTAVMIAEILAAARYRVGLFTSPHIMQFEERMRVDGKCPTPEQVTDLVDRLRGPIQKLDNESATYGPTYFEIATAMAWLMFSDARADFAVLEVGLGGRLDSTNICCPEVTVITNISRDHMPLLGTTLSEVAREKAGIIKPGVPVVSGVEGEGPAEVVAKRAAEQGAPLWELGREVQYHYEPGPVRSWPLPSAPGLLDVSSPVRSSQKLPVALLGEHQGRNAALAVAACDAMVSRGFRIESAALPQGLAKVKWPARIEVLADRPTVVVDAAHNVASIAALRDTLRTQFPPSRKRLIFAVSNDKDAVGMLRQIAPEFDECLLTSYALTHRAFPVADLQATAASIEGVRYGVCPSPLEAWQIARAESGPDDLICITGSFFLAAELRRVILAEQAVNAPDPDGSAVEAGSEAYRAKLDRP